VQYVSTLVVGYLEVPMSLPSYGVSDLDSLHIYLMIHEQKVTKNMNRWTKWVVLFYNNTNKFWWINEQTVTMFLQICFHDHKKCLCHASLRIYYSSECESGTRKNLICEVMELAQNFVLYFILRDKLVVFGSL